MHNCIKVFLESIEKEDKNHHLILSSSLVANNLLKSPSGIPRRFFETPPEVAFCKYLGNLEQVAWEVPISLSVLVRIDLQPPSVLISNTRLCWYRIPILVRIGLQHSSVLLTCFTTRP